MAANPDYTRSVVDALRRRGHTCIRIQGRSMYPVLHHGDQVIVEPVAYDELAPGDMIVFYDGRGIICHRLLRKSQRQCHLKGDTNTWADPPVDWSQVLGRVTHVVEEAEIKREVKEREVKEGEATEGKLTKSLIRCIDLESQRRRAALVARFSYVYAFYYQLLHLLGRCRWWERATPASDDYETEFYRRP